jgi:outer membrane protein assembly factor BamE (lipoprotein component of BamABCDE complex)
MVKSFDKNRWYYVYEQNMLWKWCLFCKWFNIRKWNAFYI